MNKKYLVTSFLDRQDTFTAEEEVATLEVLKESAKRPTNDQTIEDFKKQGLKEVAMCNALGIHVALDSFENAEVICSEFYFYKNQDKVEVLPKGAQLLDVKAIHDRITQETKA